MNKARFDFLVFALVVCMAIYIGIAGIMRFAGTDPLCEAMVSSQGGRIALNVFYIVVGVSGAYVGYTYGIPLARQLR